MRPPLIPLVVALLRTRPSGRAVDADSRGHDAVAYNDLRMPVALAGHAEVNSTDAWTPSGTSAL